MNKLCAILVWMAFVGCGGGDRVALSVEKDKRISELTETELRDICRESLDGYIDTWGSNYCSALGLGATHLGDCADIRDRCFEVLDVSMCDRMELDPMMCDVTVGEMERCVNDALALLDRLPSINCSMSKKDLEQAARSYRARSTPPSCKAMEGRCRLGFFYEMGESPRLSPPP